MIVIRKMTQDDLGQVAAIEKELFTQPWSENAFASSLASADTCYFVAADGDILAGYCGYLRSFEEADITNVAVASSYRRQGIAYDMLTQLMACGKTAGIERYTLEVRESNEAAINLYQKLGFVSVGKRKRFYAQPTEDALIMWTEPASEV